jgi:hypothetical protein
MKTKSRLKGDKKTKTKKNKLKKPKQTKGSHFRSQPRRYPHFGWYGGLMTLCFLPVVSGERFRHEKTRERTTGTTWATESERRARKVTAITSFMAQ